MSSLSEVDSLSVSGVVDLPHILRMAIVVGLDAPQAPLRSLQETARHLKAIGLEKKILSIRAVEYIEQQALAKLRKNPKIRMLYEEVTLRKAPRLRCRLSPSRAPKTDAPSRLASAFISTMRSRRLQAAARKGL